ncbi:hypothetical protein [Serratia fonticola]|uniref:hypothetical protein n=1 Tax=Serratia fonticola TaxID=47917 RepID=UPI0003F6C5F1|nr:hypothetical protein [Serratia fonticola]
MNQNVNTEILDLFANEKFWGVRIEVMRNANTSQTTLLRLLESDVRKRGVVHHAAREKLEHCRVAFGVDGLPE